MPPWFAPSNLNLSPRSSQTGAVQRFLFHPANGLPVQSIESVTLAVYRDQTGGNALWQEIQNVVVDTDGHYSLVLGATQNEGMPLELFTTGEPRWLGAQFNRPGEVEQPRVLLVSVPYALKASDAETLGGRPASAYLLAAPSMGTGTHEASAAATATSTTTPAKPKATPQNSGMPNFIGKFTNTTDLIDSSMYEVGGNVGISTITPLISLDVRTGSLPQMGIAGTTDYLTFFASDQFGPAIYWDPAKDMRFGKGGSGLYNPFGFVEQMRIKSSNGNVGIGTQTPGSKVDVAGDVNLSGSMRFLGSPFLQMPGGLSNFNIALGLGALGSNTTGIHNTASGGLALGSNTAGNQNTASGSGALQDNTTGNQNVASGSGSLSRNKTGAANTASGFSALNGNTTGTNNTAAGWLALNLNTTGNNNIGIGYQAALNVAGGNSNNIHLGSQGSSGDSSTIRIGTPGTHSSFFAAGVRGVTTGNHNAIPVVIDSAGQLGTVAGLANAITVQQNYMGTINLSCPSGYTAIAASCTAGVEVVINAQFPSPPAGAYLDYLIPNTDAATGVHCDLGNPSFQSQAVLRCSK